MAQRIDTLIAKAWNVIKKTGDTMFETPGDPSSGWLTLAKDAVNPLHAVPLRQLQAATASGFSPTPRQVGTKYTTQMGSHHAGANLGTAVGDGRMGLIFVGGTHTWDQLTIGVSSAGTRTFRLAVYALDSATLLPTALLADAGVVGIGALAEQSVSISPALTTTSPWLGLAAIIETLGTGNVNITTSNHDASSHSLSVFGTTTAQPAGGIIFQVNVLYCSTGIAGAPAPGAWSIPPSTPQTTDGGVYIRKSA